MNVIKIIELANASQNFVLVSADNSWNGVYILRKKSVIKSVVPPHFLFLYVYVWKSSLTNKRLLLNKS